jgi:hypothetical protein
MGWGPITTATGTLAFGTTITERPVTVYARKSFTIADPAQVRSLRLECLADDGAAVYLNGTRVSPTIWGLDPGTQVGGSIYYNQLSSRFRANNSAEGDYDVLTLSGAGIPILNAAPALNVLAVEVHQNTTDSSDCALDASLTASFAAPVAGIWGVAGFSGENFIYWTDPSWTLESTGNLGTWTGRTDLQSPVPVIGDDARLFYRLQMP